MKQKLVLVAAVLALFFSQAFGKGKFKQEQFVNLLNVEVGYSVSPNGYFFPIWVIGTVMGLIILLICR